jgi:uncharacterized phiE125 gp8 family phage protein
MAGGERTDAVLGGTAGYLIEVARAQAMPQLAAVSPAILANLIAAASAMFQRWGRKIASETFTEYYNGDGTDSLLLEQRPVITLTSVTITDDDDVETILLGTNFRVDARIAEIRFKPSSTADYSSFPSGFQNVKAIYTAGYAAIPEDVQEAVCELVAWLYSANKQDPAMAAERLGDYSYQRAIAEGLPLSISRVINDYRGVRISR